MLNRSRPNPLKHQHGLALLVMVIAIALSVIAYFVSSLSIDQVKAERDLKTQQALKQAKEALIAYAILYSESKPGEYGFLPCPDLTDSGSITLEGAPESDCGDENVNEIGLFPWRSLETGPFKGGGSECLRYAVSGMYKNYNLNVGKKVDMLNEDSNGYFKTYNASNIIVQGLNPEDRPVAVIFAPGSALPGQARSNDSDYVCGNDYDLTHFLDDTGTFDNASLVGVPDNPDSFRHSGPGTDEFATPFNDKFITITREELWYPIISRSDYIEKITDLTEALARCLSAYANNGSLNRLPWPAPVNFSGADYRYNASYDDSSDLYAGRFATVIDDTDAATGHGITDLLNYTGCSALNLSSGNTANLTDDNTEYRKLYNNWKDHFFYALSLNYKPANIAAVSCTDPGGCIKVGTNQYAGVVFFSGSRKSGFRRNAPPTGGTDDKQDVSKYLENDNDDVFKKPAVGDDSDTYKTAASAESWDDIMFCLSEGTPLGVGLC